MAVSGRPVRLSATEYKLLSELSTNAGRVLTRDQILQRVWGPHYSGDSQLLRAVVKNIRRKLGDDAREPQYIFNRAPGRLPYGKAVVGPVSEWTR